MSVAVYVAVMALINFVSVYLIAETYEGEMNEYQAKETGTVAQGTTATG